MKDSPTQAPVVSGELGLASQPVHRLNDAPASDFHHGPINILIVDDEPRNLAVLETILENPSYRLVRAESGDQALHELVHDEFALIILDIRMPDMSGLELAEIVKERKKTSQVPIIFLTAYYNEDEHVLAGYSSGAVDYLQKPVNPTILRSKVAVFAELHRKERENARTNSALLAEMAERRQAEEQMRETIAELDAFSYSIAHDMRGPLRAMRSFSLILIDEHSAQLDETARHYLQRIAASAKRMDLLIIDILDYSKVVRGKVELRPTDIEQLINEIVASYPSLDKARADITLEGSFPRVLANEAALTQVVSNLLDNAVKFVATGVRPRVRVWCTDDDGFVRVWFEDNGIGIPKDSQAQLFNIFVRLNPAHDYEGTGIGLAIVRKAAERMGGRAGLESEEGQGSRFWVRLEKAKNS